jgi:hypothetical protein
MTSCSFTGFYGEVSSPHLRPLFPGRPRSKYCTNALLAEFFSRASWQGTTVQRLRESSFPKVSEVRCACPFRAFIASRLSLSHWAGCHNRPARSPSSRAASFTNSLEEARQHCAVSGQGRTLPTRDLLELHLRRRCPRYGCFISPKLAGFWSGLRRQQKPSSGCPACLPRNIPGRAATPAMPGLSVPSI